MKTQRQQLNLLNETVAFYSEDPSRRGLFNGACVYRSSEGKRCAVGRHMLNSAFKSGKVHNSKSAKGVGERFDGGLDDTLKAKYKGFTIQLWNHLQSIHDTHENWNDTGLTKTGKDNVFDLQSKIKEGQFNTTEI